MNDLTEDCDGSELKLPAIKSDEGHLPRIVNREVLSSKRTPLSIGVRSGQVPEVPEHEE